MYEESHYTAYDLTKEGAKWSQYDQQSNGVCKDDEGLSVGGSYLDGYHFLADKRYSSLSQLMCKRNAGQELCTK